MTLAKHKKHFLSILYTYIFLHSAGRIFAFEKYHMSFWWHAFFVWCAQWIQIRGVVLIGWHYGIKPEYFVSMGVRLQTNAKTLRRKFACRSKRLLIFNWLTGRLWELLLRLPSAFGKAEITESWKQTLKANYANWIIAGICIFSRWNRFAKGWNIILIQMLFN